jgi:hypothetical protein
MKENTKNAIYMALDLLESLKKSSYGNSSFIRVNNFEYEEVKNELLQLLRSDNQSNVIQEKKKILIGSLPYILMDKTKFPNNESIVKLAENSLNFKISSWKKRGREEMIGLIIAKIADDNENTFEKFMDLWKDFIANRDLNEYKKVNKEFVDVWLDFFNEYRGKK